MVFEPDVSYMPVHNILIDIWGMKLAAARVTYWRHNLTNVYYSNCHETHGNWWLDMALQVYDANNFFYVQNSFHIAKHLIKKISQVLLKCLYGNIRRKRSDFWGIFFCILHNDVLSHTSAMVRIVFFFLSTFIKYVNKWSRWSCFIIF